MLRGVRIYAQVGAKAQGGAARPPEKLRGVRPDRGAPPLKPPSHEIGVSDITVVFLKFETSRFLENSLICKLYCILSYIDLVTAADICRCPKSPCIILCPKFTLLRNLVEMTHALTSLFTPSS